MLGRATPVWRHMAVHAFLERASGVALWLATGLACLGVGDRVARGQAIPGEPCGVASVRVPVTGKDAEPIYQMGGFQVVERQGRAFYPVFLNADLLERFADNLLDAPDSVPRQVELLFLFRGAEPLELTIRAAESQSVTLVPRPEPPRISNRLIQRWWRGYNSVARREAAAGDHPPLVYTYLTTMLSQRLARRTPLLSQLVEPESEGWQTSLELIVGAEKLRNAAVRTAMAGRAAVGEPADQPLPAAPRWAARVVEVPAGEVAVEPLAMHVPEECFYIRFGTFADYLWFRHLSREYGGDLGRMVTLRGSDAQVDQRIQQQMAVKETVLMDLFGDKLAAEVALIGRDLFFREGSAFGTLLVARNNLALTAALTQQRMEALAAEQSNGAKLETERIEGHDVSFLSTPDNRLRSFYAVDGDYHLVTTSRTMVERFFAAGRGAGALGAAEEFRLARSRFPVARNDTVFAYFSSAFFRGLLSPDYQIELERRLQAVAQIELVRMAELAAAAEGISGREIPDLIAAGLLPEGFGRQPDGSEPRRQAGEVVDSLRGARGRFLPVPDVALEKATATEVARYAERARVFENDWRQLDPIMVGIQRAPAGETGQERVVIDAQVAPLGDEKYGWLLALLGPPTTQRIAAGPGELVSAQAYVQGGLLSAVVPPHWLFVGLEDIPTEADPASDARLPWLRFLRSAPGYLGAWPKPGFLDWLPVWLQGEVDAEGFSQLPPGVWRWQGGDFSALSFRKEVLDRVRPQLHVEEANSAAQIRIHASDLSQSQVAPWLNAWYYRRAQQASRGNVRLLHLLSNQLAVPRSEALETANRLLDTRLVCSLGGEYQIAERPTGLPGWISTSWPADGQTIPADYRAPVLHWLRGLDLAVVKEEDRIALHAELTIQRQAAGGLDPAPLLKGLLGK